MAGQSGGAAAPMGLSTQRGCRRGVVGGDVYARSGMWRSRQCCRFFPGARCKRAGRDCRV